MKTWLSSFVLLLTVSGVAMAKPDLSQPLGPTLADRGSAHYQFTQHTLS